MFNKNNFGQVGETVTWFVATIIIVLILFVSVFISSIGPWNDKNLGFSRETDYIASKSFFAWLLTEDDTENSVYEQLREEENLNEFNGGLALDIFEDNYGGEYFEIWVGISNGKFEFLSVNWWTLSTGIYNIYFGFRPEDIVESCRTYADERVILDSNRSIELILKTSDCF